MTTELRAADPAAHLDPSPTSPAAEAMLRQVLAAPRVERRTSRPRRRLAYGVVAAAALAAGTVVVTGLPGSAPDARAAGYTVARHADGSVEVDVDFAAFSNPDALRASLRDQHVRAVVLAGPDRHPDLSRLPACAKYRPMPWPDDGSTGDDPFEQQIKGTSDARLLLRPLKLPADGTFVLEIHLDAHGRVASVIMDVALGAPPTCVR